MSLLIFLSLIILSSFIYVSRPLSLGALVMGLSLILTCFLGMTLNSWWGLILFLIYVGALLVLFVYVMAMSPNCFFSRPEKMNMTSVVLTILMLFTLSMFSFYTPEIYFSNYSENFLVSQKPVLLDSFYNMTCLVSLSIILLLAMVAVVSLIPGKSQGSPLRPFNSKYVQTFTTNTSCH